MRKTKHKGKHSNPISNTAQFADKVAKMQEANHTRKTQQHITQILSAESTAKAQTKGSKLLNSFDENIVIVGQSPSHIIEAKLNQESTKEVFKPNIQIFRKPSPNRRSPHCHPTSPSALSQNHAIMIKNDHPSKNVVQIRPHSNQRSENYSTMNRVKDHGSNSRLLNRATRNVPHAATNPTKPQSLLRESSKQGQRVFSHKKLKTENESSQKKLNFSSRRDLKELIFVDQNVFAAKIERKNKVKTGRTAANQFNETNASNFA